MRMNVFQFAAVVELNWKANLSDMNPYTPKYTFYHDFAIAEFCEVYMRDKDAIRKTYNDCIRSYGNNYKALTELIMVLNHKLWAYYQKVDSRYLGIDDAKAMEFSKLYDTLWKEAQQVLYKNFEGNNEAMSYYYDVTD